MKIYTREDPCLFVKGEEIEVGDFESCAAGKKEFYMFLHELEYPFVIINRKLGRGEHIASYKYAKKIQPDLKIDAKVWVRDTDQHSWSKRHFSHWVNERIVCFDAGKTSHTVNFVKNTKELSNCSWNYYILEDPNKLDSHKCCK